MSFISNKCEFVKIFIKKCLSSLASKAFSNVSYISLITNQSEINFNAARQFFEFYIYGGNILLKYTIFRNNSVTHFLNFIPTRNKSNTKTRSNSFILYFLTLVAFRNKLHFRWISIGSFISVFECCSYQRQILMHEGNYQQLYHTSIDFCNS